MSFPEIITNRLRLSPFEKADIYDLYSLWTDPVVRKHLWDDQIISKEMADAVIAGSIACFKDRRFGFWAIRLISESALIGFCGLRPFVDADIEEEKIEIIYGLNPDHFGKGLATEAAEAVLKYGFEDAALDRIYAGADAPNTASFRVMERLGMRFEKKMKINGLETIYYAIDKL